jgi:hypothetical protein
VTILGLEYLQESSRKNVLGSLLEERDGEYQAALADFNNGKFGGICVILICLYDWVDYIANVVYIEAKERSKELLDISKAKLDDVDDELRRTFQAMEEVRRWIFCNLKARVLNGMGMDSQAKRTNEARIN